MGKSNRDLKRRAMAEIAEVQAILREWDPLGVAPGELAPADEYDSYAPAIVSLVAKGASVSEVVDHLSGLESLGIEAGVSAEVVAERVVRVLGKSD